MKVKIKVTYEWITELLPEWYIDSPFPNDPIATEKQSFEHDEFQFIAAMDALDRKGKTEIEIEKLD